MYIIRDPGLVNQVFHESSGGCIAKGIVYREGKPVNRIAVNSSKDESLSLLE